MIETVRTSNTFWCKLYIAGPVDQIEQICREYCYDVGLCVTVTPTNYIFTGGEESGVEIGLINYPLYPASDEDIEKKVTVLGELILEKVYQGSFTIMMPTETKFYSRRSQDRR